MARRRDRRRGRRARPGDESLGRLLAARPPGLDHRRHPPAGADPQPGSAFSLFQTVTPLLAVLALVVAVFLVRAVRRTDDRVVLVAFALVLGGALGNVADRLFRSPGWFRGAVVDFISFRRFSTFNVADSAITVGAVLLVLLEHRRRPVARPRRDRRARRAARPRRPGGGARRPGGRDAHRLEPSRGAGAPRRRRGPRRRARPGQERTGWPPARPSSCWPSRRRPSSPPPRTCPSTCATPTTDVIVVEKPAGLVVHPGAGHEHGTLVHGLLARFPEIADGRGSPPARHRAPPRPRHQRAARRRPLRRRLRRVGRTTWPPTTSSGVTSPSSAGCRPRSGRSSTRRSAGPPASGPA